MKTYSFCRNLLSFIMAILILLFMLMMTIGMIILLFVANITSSRCLTYIFIILILLADVFICISILYREKDIHFSVVHINKKAVCLKTYAKTRINIDFKNLKEIGVGVRVTLLSRDKYIYISDGKVLHKDYDWYGFLSLRHSKSVTKQIEHTGNLIEFLITKKSLIAILDVYKDKITGLDTFFSQTRQGRRLKSKLIEEGIMFDENGE